MSECYYPKEAGKPKRAVSKGELVDILHCAAPELTEGLCQTPEGILYERVAFRSYVQCLHFMADLTSILKHLSMVFQTHGALFSEVSAGV